MISCNRPVLNDKIEILAPRCGEQKLSCWKRHREARSKILFFENLTSMTPDPPTPHKPSPSNCPYYYLYWSARWRRCLEPVASSSSTPPFQILWILLFGWSIDTRMSSMALLMASPYFVFQAAPIISIMKGGIGTITRMPLERTRRISMIKCSLAASTTVKHCKTHLSQLGNRGMLTRLRKAMSITTHCWNCHGLRCWWNWVIGLVLCMMFWSISEFHFWLTRQLSRLRFLVTVSL